MDMDVKIQIHGNYDPPPQSTSLLNSILMSLLVQVTRPCKVVTYIETYTHTYVRTYRTARHYIPRPRLPAGDNNIINVKT